MLIALELLLLQISTFVMCPRELDFSREGRFQLLIRLGSDVKW